jgi:hypothetical protein
MLLFFFYSFSPFPNVLFLLFLKFSMHHEVENSQCPGYRDGDAATPEPPDPQPPPPRPPPTPPPPLPPPPPQPPLSPSVSPRSSPAPYARRRRPAPRRGSTPLVRDTFARPGELIQEKLLFDFHCTAVPGALQHVTNQKK